MSSGPVYPPAGTVRILTCTRCGDVYRETWVAQTSTGFRIEGWHADGTRPQPETVPGCSKHPTHPGARGPHEVERVEFAPGEPVTVEVPSW